MIIIHRPDRLLLPIIIPVVLLPLSILWLALYSCSLTRHTLPVQHCSGPRVNWRRLWSFDGSLCVCRWVCDLCEAWRRLNLTMLDVSMLKSSLNLQQTKTLLCKDQFLLRFIFENQTASPSFLQCKTSSCFMVTQHESVHCAVGRSPLSTVHNYKQAFSSHIFFFTAIHTHTHTHTVCCHSAACLFLLVASLTFRSLNMIKSNWLLCSDYYTQRNQRSPAWVPLIG